jgi:hypothetical protein
MLVLLIVATIGDLALAVLLVAVSGFVFGGGPEGMHGDLSGAAMWAGSLFACLAAPLAGFALRGNGRPAAGATLGWVPPIVAFLIAAGMIPGV